MLSLLSKMTEKQDFCDPLGVNEQPVSQLEDEIDDTDFEVSLDQVKREAHSVETPLKHGSGGINLGQSQRLRVSTNAHIPKYLIFLHIYKILLETYLNIASISFMVLKSMQRRNNKIFKLFYFLQIILLYLFLCCL